jgi:hypothetical protein
VRAAVEEERAMQDELALRARELHELAAAARQSARTAIERVTRINALKAYVDAGGALRQFEQAWPPLYARLWARHVDVPQ